VAITDVLTETKDKMGKAVDVAKDDFNTVRTGRINPALFQKIPVDYYGTPTPLAQLASLQAPEARTLIVTPYDKTALKEIERAIATFPNLGASPTNDGTLVRVTIPELTQDRRKEFVKIVRGKGEDAKVAIRNIRRRAKDDLDAQKTEVGDDEVARAEKELEAITKSFVDQIDDALKKKEAELLEV
jgi:ribosome recycling factor